MGLRRGELAGLEWKDIDYENKTMIMRKFCPGHRNFLQFTPVLRRAGALIETRIGNAVAKIIDVRKRSETF